MILPDKHLPVHRTVLATGAVVLHHLREPQSVSGLWEEVRKTEQVKTFQQFTLGLSFLFLIGAVDLSNDLLVRTGP